MKLNIGVASRDRLFGKAMRRLGTKFREISVAVEDLELSNPGFINFLIGLTDDTAVDDAEVVFTDSHTRQIMVGLGAYSRSESDNSLLMRSITGMIEALRLADIDDEEDFRKILSIFESQKHT